jgi:EAL domain-containing protein (putative c-di-GMP-specific phosphodiesterase class I)
VGFEALLRMPAGAQGFVSPALFIPIAEEIGLITPIGDWVVRRACAVARQWPDHLSVAVNLSPAQFKEGGVHRTVREALKETGLDPRRLQLEITEGLLLNDDAEIMQELAELKALGVSIVMDDFGTGYSSLSYLWKFPFDKIKIDRSFMRAFEADDRNVANILQAIMSLSRALKMRVTAEGVETEAQARFLRNLGCDEVQGYYFGRPTPLVDVAALVMRDGQRRMGLDAAPAEGGSIRLISG